MKLTAVYRQFMDRLSPPTRRFWSIALIVGIAVTITVLWFLYLLPFMNSKFSTLLNQDVVASFAVIISVVIASVNLIVASLNKQYTSKKQVHLDVLSQGKNVIITSRIENTGTGRITPKSFYLFINGGVQESKGNYTETLFPNILVHNGKDFDCALAIECKRGAVEKFPENLLSPKFSDVFRAMYKLQHISQSSVNFIDPGESFSEDAIFQLEPGIYRVILVGTSEEADCMCAHKIFIVDADNIKIEIADKIKAEIVETITANIEVTKPVKFE